MKQSRPLTQHINDIIGMLGLLYGKGGIQSQTVVLTSGLR